MTAGRGPVDPAETVTDPLPAIGKLDGYVIPFDVVLLVAFVLGCAFAIWSLVGLRDAYRGIGTGWISLDVPFTEQDPVERGGSR
ncbi:MAG: hypothetical protein M3340_18230 [Actinomycetota bacterium]|nr:hypothetical protein [Actinomycetota bacterium]